MHDQPPDTGRAGRLRELLAIVMWSPVMALGLIQAAVRSGLKLAGDAAADYAEQWTPGWGLLASPRRTQVTPLTAPGLTLKGMLVARGPWEDGPTCFAYSPDSEHVAAGGGQRTVSVWSLRTGRRVAKLRRRRIFRENSWAENVLAGVEPPAVQYVAFAGAHTLVAQIADGTVTVWDLATGRERYTLRGQPTSDRGGSAVYVDRGQDGPPSGLPLAAGLAVAPSPTGDTLLVTAAGPSGVGLELRETQTGHLIQASSHAGNQLPTASAVFSPNGARVAVSVGTWSERAVEIRRMDDWNDRTHINAGWPVAFSPDGDSLAAAYGTGIRVWDAATGQEAWHSREDLSYARDICFSPSGDIVVAETGRADGTQGLVRVWEASTGRELEPLVSSERGPLVGTTFSPDGRLLAVARYWSLEVWEVGTAHLLYRYAHPSRDWLFVPAHGQCAFSPDGTLLGLSTLRGLGVWHVPGRSGPE